MPLAEQINYIKEPTDLQCGQAVLAMLCKKTVEQIIAICGTSRETKLADMKTVLKSCGVPFSNERKEAATKEDLPPICILSLETPRCWHWSLYFEGVFYDPEHGISEDFPVCNRKYYWEIYKK